MLCVQNQACSKFNTSLTLEPTAQKLYNYILSHIFPFSLGKMVQSPFCVSQRILDLEVNELAPFPHSPPGSSAPYWEKTTCFTIHSCNIRDNTARHTSVYNSTGLHCNVKCLWCPASYCGQMIYSGFEGDHTTVHNVSLQCIIFYYTALHCIIFHCTVRHCPVLYYTVLHCTVLYYIKLHYTKLHYNELHCFALHRTTTAFLDLFLTSPQWPIHQVVSSQAQ